ncbi:hypothetical protein [Pseudomonas sp. HY7a-MNA-CIBAN-0227]|uniref:hypothetical protein n=1 Tax=Pseudomonas sp. HY7a-MNA-CIBAN-0227 TaxID=3140474 RepID=UPI00332043E2
MTIPPELERELIEFAFIIDSNKRINEVFLSQGMAILLEPFSKRVREGKAGLKNEDGNSIYHSTSILKHKKLYHITTHQEDKESEYDSTYFESELDNRAAAFNNYGTNPIIMHIKRLLEDDRYEILGLQNPDITDLLENFEYFRALLYKRHLEFTRSPMQEFYFDQNIEGTAKLFIVGQPDLWSGRDSLIPKLGYEFQKTEIKNQCNVYSRRYTCEGGYSVLTFLVLLEDRIIRLNYSDQDDFDFNIDGGHTIVDTETYLFTQDLTLEEFDVPATAEGFLLLKMMEI